MIKVKKYASAQLNSENNYSLFDSESVDEYVKAAKKKDFDASLDELMETTDSWRVLNAENKLSVKKVNASIVDLTPKLMEKFAEVRDEGRFFTSESNLQYMLKGLDKKFDGAGLNQYQKVALYMDAYNELAGMKDNERPSREELDGIIGTISKNYAKDRFAGLPDGADKVLSGDGTIKLSDKNAKPANTGKVKIVQDPDTGATYELQPDEAGQFSERSVRRQISSGAKGNPI
jgi:hypothetical protein